MLPATGPPLVVLISHTAQSPPPAVGTSKVVSDTLPPSSRAVPPNVVVSEYVSGAFVPPKVRLDPIGITSARAMVAPSSAAAARPRLRKDFVLCMQYHLLLN